MSLRLDNGHELQASHQRFFKIDAKGFEQRLRGAPKILK
jgi:hypothetical protein